MFNHIWYFRCIVIFTWEDRSSHTFCVSHFTVVELGLTLLDACVLFWLCNLYSLYCIFEFILLGLRNTYNIVLFRVFWLLYSNYWNLLFYVLMLNLCKWGKLFPFFVSLYPLLLIIIVISKWFRRLLLIYFYEWFLWSIEYLLETWLFINISYLVSFIFIFRLCQRLLYLWSLHNVTLFLPAFMWVLRASRVNWLVILFLMIISFIYFYPSKGTLFRLLSFWFAWASGVDWFIIVLKWPISMLVRVSTYSYRSLFSWIFTLGALLTAFGCYVLGILRDHVVEYRRRLH